VDIDVDGGTGDGVVLLIGSGWRPYREYLLQGLARQSALWLIGEEPATWQGPYIVGYSVVGALDTERPVFDVRGLVDAARAVAAERKVVGVITYDELLVTSAAQVAESLGVRGLTVAGAENCRDKSRTRAALTAAGLPQPRFALVDSLDAASAAAAEIGYPVVVKPRGMGASVGVMRAEHAEDLAGAFAITERARRTGPPVYEDGILIEECVEGPEISVDGVVADGEYRGFCLARKQLGPPPCFEEVGHVVDAADPLLADPELRAVLEGAHRVLGVLDGITHTEVRLTSRGPVIIEVNARLGGDLIPYLGKLATGVDPGQVAAQAATGEAPSLQPTAHRTAGVRFLYPPEDCRVTSVTLPDVADMPGVVDAYPIAQPGDIVRLPPNAHLGRYAFFVATADTPENCQAVLDEAAARTGLDYEPLGLDAAFEGRPW
jgi:biotin carboxylase